jgi:hypothetical protein
VSRGLWEGGHRGKEQFYTRSTQLGIALFEAAVVKVPHARWRPEYLRVRSVSRK